jgi:hypothetical protein
VSFGFFSGSSRIILVELQIDPQLESTIRAKARGLHSIWNAILWIAFSIWFLLQDNTSIIEDLREKNSRTLGNYSRGLQDYSRITWSTFQPRDASSTLENFWLVVFRDAWGLLVKAIKTTRNYPARQQSIRGLVVWTSRPEPVKIVCYMSLPSSHRSRRGHIHLPRVLPLVGCRFKTPTRVSSSGAEDFVVARLCLDSNWASDRPTVSSLRPSDHLVLLSSLLLLCNLAHLETWPLDHLTVSSSFFLLRSVPTTPTLCTDGTVFSSDGVFFLLFIRVFNLDLCFNLTYLTCHYL